MEWLRSDCAAWCCLIHICLAGQHVRSCICIVFWCFPGAQGYIEQARTIAEYAGVNTDVLGRWAYPWVPDNSGDEQDSCRFNRGAYV